MRDIGGTFSSTPERGHRPRVYGRMFATDFVTRLKVPMMVTRVICGLLLMLASFLSATLSAAELSPAIKAIQSLGKEGADNQAASRAFAALSQAPLEELPQLLSGLDEANPLGANYLRGAVDVIVDRAIRAKAPVPTNLLETFIRDTSHSPRARRLAFEVLTRFDAATPDRLVPSFLNDPSTELRRDAVQRLIDQGKKELGDEKDAAAKQLAAKTLAAAFASARDIDQIEQLAKDLKKLEVTVDLPRHFGFVMNWKLIGPFDNTGESAFDVAYPPEREIRLDATYPGKGDKSVAWIDHQTTHEHGMVDFNKALGKANGVTGYAYTEFEAKQNQTVDIRTGCICACKVWVNGQLVDGHNVYHSGTRVDQYICRAPLKAGKNTILVKVLQNEQEQNWAQDWQFQLRICDATGTAILSTDRLASTP